MTDTNARKLADGSSRIMRRNTVYHLLLGEAVAALVYWHEIMQDITDDATLERDNELILRIVRARTADHDDLAALLVELTEHET